MKADRTMIDQLQAGDQPPGPRSIHAHLTTPVVRQLVQAEAHSVLDLGCGNGWFTAALDRCGFAVTGVDNDDACLRVARYHYPHLDFQHADAVQPLVMSLVHRFDAVVAINVVDHVPLPRRLIATAISALKPGGLLVVTSNFHGYSKNLALALTGRFDSRWDPLMEAGQLKFFSRATLTSLLQEFDLRELHFETAGRVPMFAKAMLMSARLPVAPGAR